MTGLTSNLKKFYHSCNTFLFSLQTSVATHREIIFVTLTCVVKVLMFDSTHLFLNIELFSNVI